MQVWLGKPAGHRVTRLLGSPRGGNMESSNYPGSAHRTRREQRQKPEEHLLKLHTRRKQQRIKRKMNMGGGKPRGCTVLEERAASCVSAA